jgi:hypothetical protein
MPKRKKIKRISGSFENVIDFKHPHKPEGEDFFVFAIVYDDPDHPTWDERQTCFGSWIQAKKSISLMMNMWAQLGKPAPSCIEMYQGEKARQYLFEGFCQERRFQQERSATPNN